MLRTGKSAELTADLDIEIDKYVPDYTLKCEVCGDSPVVLGVKDGGVIYQGSMCGVCTWGEAEMLDPEEWNK
jgi:hypothetical protein